MIWTDLMLDQVVADHAVIEGMARVFGLRALDIALVDKIADQREEASQDQAVIIEHSHLQGDFPLQLSVYLRRGELEQRICSPASEQEVIANLCAEWKCSALFSDEALNPYSWFLMTPTGRLEEVRVDAGRLDDQDEYVITKVVRMVRQIPVAV